MFVELAKFFAAILAVYIGILGIRGVNNHDSQGQLSQQGRRVLTAFLLVSFLGILAQVGESMQKARDSASESRRYIDAAARDNLNLRRSEEVLRRSDSLVRNLQSLDSLSRIQLSETHAALNHQRGLLDHQQSLQRSAERGLYSATASLPIVNLFVSSAFPPARRFLDSMWTVAIDSISAAQRKFNQYPQSESIAVVINDVWFWYRSDDIGHDQIEPVSFQIRRGRLPSAVLMEVLTRVELQVYCCGFPQTPQEPLYVMLASAGGEGDELVRGSWRDGMLTVRSSEYLTAISTEAPPKLSIPDLIGATVVLWFGGEASTSRMGLPIDRVGVIAPHLSATVSFEVGDERRLTLGSERWARVTDKAGCNCYQATIRSADVETFPGELTGGRLQPIPARSTEP